MQPTELSQFNRGDQTPQEDSLSFEQALQRWEEVVDLLERGSLTLEESVQLYEEGMRLRNLCYARLSEAEGRMKVLQQSADGTVVEEMVE